MYSRCNESEGGGAETEKEGAECGLMLHRLQYLGGEGDACVEDGLEIEIEAVDRNGKTR
jgi:hypothetical protein